MELCAILLLCYTILMLFSLKYKVKKEEMISVIFLPFYKISTFLWDKLIAQRRRKEEQKPFGRYLNAVFGGRKEKIKSYYIEKLALALGIVFFGTGLSVCFQIVTGSESKLQNGERIIRPDYGEGTLEEELYIRVEGEKEKERITVDINERQYTKEQKKEFLNQTIKNLDGWILGENNSLDEVRQRLHLGRDFQNGMVSAEWFQEPYGILDEEGYIVSEIPESGKLLKLTAMLECEEETGEYSRYVKVFPPLYTPREERMRKVKEAVERANKNEEESSVLHLPQEVEGKILSWSKAPVRIAWYLGILSLLAGLLVYFGRDKEIEKKARNRSHQLLMDYPEMLFKLSTLLSTGMTIRGVFSKIALEYKNQDSQKRYVYEEMIETYYEMQRGVPEAAAYENFGRRCREPKYVKLGLLLSQNLKKGTAGLSEILVREAALSLEERSQVARKMGEEAGTKLLLPMILMMAVVLVILIVPSIMAF